MAPPRMTFPAIAAPPVPPNLLSTFTVCGTYPDLLTVTVKGSVRRSFTNFAGVMPRSPVERRTSAAEGSLVTVNFSCTPRVIVAHEVKSRAGNRTKAWILIGGAFSNGRDSLGCTQQGIASQR